MANERLIHAEASRHPEARPVVSMKLNNEAINSAKARNRRGEAMAIR